MDRARCDVPRWLWIARAVQQALKPPGESLEKRLDELDAELTLAKARK
jgi:hypothetical protein